MIASTSVARCHVPIAVWVGLVGVLLPGSDGQSTLAVTRMPSAQPTISPTDFEMQDVLLNATFNPAYLSRDYRQWNCSSRIDLGEVPTTNACNLNIFGPDIGWRAGRQLCIYPDTLCNDALMGIGTYTHFQDNPVVYGPAMSPWITTQGRGEFQLGFEVRWSCATPQSITFEPVIRGETVDGDAGVVPVTPLSNTTVVQDEFAMYRFELDVSGVAKVSVGVNRTLPDCAVYIRMVKVWFDLTRAPSTSPTLSPSSSIPTYLPTSAVPTGAPSTSVPSSEPTSATPTAAPSRSPTPVGFVSEAPTTSPPIQYATDIEITFGGDLDGLDTNARREFENEIRNAVIRLSSNSISNADIQNVELQSGSIRAIVTFVEDVVTADEAGALSIEVAKGLDITAGGATYSTNGQPPVVLALDSLAPTPEATTTVLPSGLGESASDSNSSGGVIAAVIVILILAILGGVGYWKRDEIKERLGMGPGTKFSSAYESNGMPNSTATLLMEQIKSREECDVYQDPAIYADADELSAHVKQWCTELRRSDVKLTTLLGAGEFGEVFLGSLRTKEAVMPCACKTLRKTATPAEKMDFLSEAAVMGQFVHPNVVSLIGVVMKGDVQIILIELMENGELLGYLTKHQQDLQLSTLIKAGLDVAQGMSYLANKGFVHRDLAARNILMNGSLDCKVADFGLSKSLDDDSEYFTSEGGKVPIRWTAPESLQTRKYTTSSDVWSFGILLWEIMSRGERPYGQMGNLEVYTKVEQGLRPECPSKCPKEIHDIMMKCWDIDRRARITFDGLVSELEVAKETAEANGYLILDGADDDAIENSGAGGAGFDYAAPEVAVVPRAPAALPDYGTPQDAGDTNNSDVTLAPNETYGSEPVPAPRRQPSVKAAYEYATQEIGGNYLAPVPLNQNEDYGTPQDAAASSMRPRAMSGKFGFDDSGGITPETYAEPQHNHTSPIPAARPPDGSSA